MTIILNIIIFNVLSQEDPISNKIVLVYILFLNIFIYLSDFMDGRLARKWSVCSKQGEYLDILSDLFYITSQYYLFIKTGYMEVVMLPCICLEFLVFIGTSLLCRGVTNGNFFFNKIGKFVAVYYYVLPTLYIGAIYLNCRENVFAEMNGIGIALTVMAIVDRIILVYNHTKYDVVS